MDSRNVSTLWSSVLVETLHRLGLKFAIICPGSRSSSLTLAFAQHPQIETLPILDERSAAFFALGRAKRSRRPVVLVCTSGTAGANFYPAIIEATESQIPLIVLTADRPPELRHCHAGQTIDQLKLYGYYPRWQSELTIPSSALESLQYLRQTIVHAWERSLYPQAGVVHLNCPFQEPLAPIPDAAVLSLADSFPLDSFWAMVRPISGNLRISTLVNSDLTLLLQHCSEQAPWPAKGIIIAGLYQGDDPQSYCQAIAALSQHLAYPVFGDALSPLRNFFDGSYPLITTYDFVLRNPQIAQTLGPDCIIQIGELPTSKNLRIWLSQLSCPRYIVDTSRDNFDPLHAQTQHLRLSLFQFVTILAEQKKPASRKKEYLQEWQVLEQKIQQQMTVIMTEREELFEGKIAWLISQSLPSQTPIFIANSMPIRHVEFFWQPNQTYSQPYFNRGANGIDGTLSSALGMAHQETPSLLLTGDLSLLHDTNGFLIRPYFRGHLTIILINNNGGGIFEMLAIASKESYFENYFATPQSINFAKLCVSYNIDYFLINDQQTFVELISNLPQEGIRLLEIKTDRKADAAWLKKIGHQLAFLTA